MMTSPHHPAYVVRPLDTAYAGLEPTSQRAYRILATLPSPVFGVDVAAAACSLTWSEAEWVLQILDEEKLIDVAGLPATDRVPQYRIGEAAQAHVADMSHGEEAQGLDRMATWILVSARIAQRELAPHQPQPVLPRPGDHPGGPGLDAPFHHTDVAGMLEWLEQQSTTLLPLLTALEERSRPDLAWRTVDAFWPLFQRRHPHPLWTDAHRVGLDAARADGDRAGCLRMLLSGALGLLNAGQYPEAADWNQEALDAARAEDQVRDEGQALHGLALVRLAEHRVEDATALVAQALSRWESCDYRRGEALAQITLARCLMGDQPRRAVDLLSCARTTLDSEPGSAHHRVRARALRGRAFHLAGDPTAAVADLAKARTEVPDADTSPWHGRTVAWLAEARKALALRRFA